MADQARSGSGGGGVGVAELLRWRPGRLDGAVAAANGLATYLPGDIGRDWGALERFTPYNGVTQEADIVKRTVTRSGLWSPAHLRYWSIPTTEYPRVLNPPEC